MSFPQMRIGIEADARPDRIVQTPEEMRQAIHKASHESSLVRHTMYFADMRGLNGEDRYTALAYQALVALETYYQQYSELLRLLPVPLVPS